MVERPGRGDEQRRGDHRPKDFAGPEEVDRTSCAVPSGGQCRSCPLPSRPGDNHNSLASPIPRNAPCELACTPRAASPFPRLAHAQKDAAVKSAAAHADANWPTALKIWEWAEPGYQEKKSAAALAEVAEKAGFTVKKSVAGIPTAFTAEFGSGKPVIGILGEFDALPELSQEAVPFRKPREGGNGYGHACGHHLFGVASLSASIAIAEQIKAGKLKGTVRFYMCPAEEGGAAKVFMARAGLFDDCDTVLHWHPGSRNSAGDATCLARIAVKFRFHGTPAHASGSPEKGRTALDALLLTMHAVELLREHTPDGTRLHHTVTSGGGARERRPRVRGGLLLRPPPEGRGREATLPAAAEVRPGRGARDRDEARSAVPRRHDGDSAEQHARAGREEEPDRAQRPEVRRGGDEVRVRLQESFAEKAALDDIAKVFDSSGKSSGGSHRRGRRVVGRAGDGVHDRDAGCRARRATRGRRSRAAARRSARRG